MNLKQPGLFNCSLLALKDFFWKEHGEEHLGIVVILISLGLQKYDSRNIVNRKMILVM